MDIEKIELTLVDIEKVKSVIAELHEKEEVLEPGGLFPHKEASPLTERMSELVGMSRDDERNEDILFEGQTIEDIRNEACVFDDDNDELSDAAASEIAAITEGIVEERLSNE